MGEIMGRTLVIKIGGSYWGASSSAAHRCKEIAEDLVRLSESYDVVVVPSAFKGRTDDLKAAAEVIYGKPLRQCHEVDAILGKGELEASQQLYDDLLRLGHRTRIVFPTQPDFPIHADNSGVVDVLDSYRKLDALARECRERGEILIVPGFVAKNCTGIVTLGRNGSDYSAVLVGEGVKADEIVKLGAAPGVPDPSGNGFMKEVASSELLARVGANGEGYEKVDCIFHPGGLRILSQGRSINVTNSLRSYVAGPIVHGTVIHGS